MQGKWSVKSTHIEVTNGSPFWLLSLSCKRFDLHSKIYISVHSSWNVETVNEWHSPLHCLMMPTSSGFALSLLKFILRLQFGSCGGHYYKMPINTPDMRPGGAEQEENPLNKLWSLLPADSLLSVLSASLPHPVPYAPLPTSTTSGLLPSPPSVLVSPSSLPPSSIVILYLPTPQKVYLGSEVAYFSPMIYSLSA